MDVLPLLQLDDLHVHYADGVDAIRGVSFCMVPGERVGLIGPNGAGKTTLMLAVMNAVRFSGRIVVDGLDVCKKNQIETRSRCGMVFQDAEDHLFMPTLLDDVAFGPLNQGRDPAEAQHLALDVIAQTGLAGLEHRSSHHMSGGQQRAAALAAVLAMQVKLLLLDEPGANLDCRARRRLFDLLEARPEAVLLATHDLPMVERLCTRAILLDEGRVIADRPTAELFGDRDLLRRHGVVD
jgi:cobalt/nickel transport system ATP-binding protein